MKKYRIYRIHVVGNNAWRCDVDTDDIESFREETANTFKVNLIKVRLCYETNEEWVERR